MDEELAELTIAARYFFIGLWTQADRAGRLEDRPRMLKAQILPWDDEDADQLLGSLSPKFIIRYEADGKRYIQIVKFLAHQRPHVKEAASTIPEPKAGTEASPRICPGTTKVVPSTPVNGEWGMGNGELGMGNVEQAQPGQTEQTHNQAVTACGEDAKALTLRLTELLRKNNARARIPADLGRWEAEADRLLRKDALSVDEARQVLEWAQSDGFWKAHILSMGKFKEKYPTLKLQMAAGGRGAGGHAEAAQDRKYEHLAS